VEKEKEMAPPDARESGITPEQPQNPRRLRTVEPAEAEPVPRSPERPPHNLPSELSSFIGREKELAEVRQLLEDTRLLTLTGSGGCGKTRLALVAASEVVGKFEDGVWLVELAPLADPSLVPQAVASTLGVREQTGRSTTGTLSSYLGSKNMLLVLDNCEHLIEACAEIVEALLRSCSELSILVTSRESLGITGEVAWPVPPLSLPDIRRLPDVESPLRYESARLFVERTVAVKPTFELTEQNALSVVQICYRLDGIPLALELAAARTRVLSVEEISERLENAFRLLAAGGRTVTSRHKTLRATMDWSHELLPEQERILFRRLSVFAGGFTLAAAESVCAREGLEWDEVLGLLSRLVEKSLVTVRENGGQTRYHLLETVRQYGQEKLAASENEPEVGLRHAAFFVGLAEEAERELDGPDQTRWLAFLEADHDNFRAALSWSLGEGGDVGLGVRLAAALWPFWFSRGYLSEGRRWLERAITRSAPTSTLARARALNGAGSIATFQDEYEAAKALIEEGLALNRELGDKEGIASSLANLCGVAMLGQRDDIPVLAALEEAKALRPEIEDRRTVGNLLILEGRVALAQGDLERAVELGEESLAMYRAARDAYGIVMCLLHIAFVTLARSDYERTAALLREGLQLSRELEHKVFIQYCVTGLAGVAASKGFPVRAARLWGAAERLSEISGGRIVREGKSTIDYERALTAARSQLEEAVWTAAWAEGRAMSPERAIEYALEREAAPEPTATSQTHPAGLSAREVDVLRLVAAGLTNAEAAEELFLSPRTVDWHLSSIYRKLGLHSRAEATRFAAEHGLL
jgi:predicted ATPase/DNA-binding CsgD family transcriptional regulator